MHLRTCTYIQLWDPASVSNTIVGKNLYLSTNGQRYAARAKVQACVACTHSSRELPFFTCTVLICVAMYMTGCITPYYTFTACTCYCMHTMYILHSYSILQFSTFAVVFSMYLHNSPTLLSLSLPPSLLQHCLPTNNSPWISIDGYALSLNLPPTCALRLTLLPLDL